MIPFMTRFIGAAHQGFTGQHPMEPSLRLCQAHVRLFKFTKFAPSSPVSKSPNALRFFFRFKFAGLDL